MYGILSYREVDHTHNVPPSCGLLQSCPLVLSADLSRDILVTMTRKSQPSKRKAASGLQKPNYWRLQDAKARFSEVVRAAQSEGPQHVTLHGVESVVIISTLEFRKLTGDLSGQELINIMQSSLLADLDLSSPGIASPVREISF